MESSFRIGIGYDIHRLVPDRRLILGGVEIPFPLGLLGHSDGDVVLHAVTDALLGAAGLPDIGECFPDCDPKYAGVDSGLLLADVMVKVRALGFTPVNVDVIIHAEQPKMSPYKTALAGSIATLMGMDLKRVAVKAKTHEGLGPIGAGEAIACTAAVLLAGPS